uniref:PKS/mFAS DH domain-containing protein n=1 Tax=Pyricularia oryzae (strain P131) TaxID=1143193 RepID=L7JQL9_PYRO1
MSACISVQPINRPGPRARGPWTGARTDSWVFWRVNGGPRARGLDPNWVTRGQILDGAPDQLHWRNVLMRNELDWLDGHQVQRQTVFPFMGYVSACVGAAMKIRGDTRVQSIELQNFGVGQAVAFSDDDSWIDILVVLDSIKESKVRRGTKTASAHFALHSSSNNSAVDITTHAGCDVLVTYGDSIGDLLSPPEVQADDEYLMLHAESDRFYNALDDIGLGYTGPFRALSGPHQEPRKQQALAKASPRAPGNVGCGHPPEDDRPIVDQTADTLGIDFLFAVDIRSWFIKEFQFEIPVFKILGEQQLLPTELLLMMDPNDKSPTRKPNPQTDSSPKKAAPAERSRAKAQTAVENKGDRKSAATRAESGSKKAEAVTRPSVQWQVPVELSTAVGDAHDESFPDQSADSVWSFETANNEFAVSKKTPISFAQSSIWFLEKLLEDPASALNIILTMELNSSLEVDRFGEAVKFVGQRHEALRTRFVHGDGFDAPMQHVLVHLTLSLEQQDVTSDAEANEVYRKLQKYRYKLGEGENMRIILVRKPDQSFHLVMGYHHINMDGVSLEVVLGELQMAYDSKRLPSFDTILQYPDFAALQRIEYKSGAWQDEIEFWRKQFDGRPPSILPLLPLTKTRSRTALTSYSSHTVEFSLGQTALAGIQSAYESSKATRSNSISPPFMICYPECWMRRISDRHRLGE